MNEDVVVSTPLATHEVDAAPVPVVKLSWAGLFGGIVVAVGVWLLLTVLGLAVGLSSFDPNDTMNTVKHVGVGTGIWSIIVAIVALFVGGLVASRTSGVLDRPAGAIHGAVLWSFATLLSIVLVGGVVKNVVRGAVQAAGAAATAVGPAQGAAGSDATTGAGNLLGRAMGLDTRELVGPINDRLRAEGKPPVAPAQVQDSLQSAIGLSIREGRIDKDILTTSIAENTGLSRGGARDIANRVESQVNQKAGAAAQDVKEGALTAAESVGKAMWWVFLGMLLGLIAAVLGSTLGVSRRQRLAAGVAVGDRMPLHAIHEAHP